MTQHQKVIELCEDGQFHCQNAFRALYIFSPHKRREDVELGKYKGGRKGQYTFERRKCIHDVANQFDYRMIKNLSAYERLDHQVRTGQANLKENTLFI